MHALELAGAAVSLLPQRAVHWPARATLFIADPHFGKAATMRAQSVAIPAGGTREDLSRLSEVLRITGAKRLVILGDLLHAKAGRTPAVLEAVCAWRAAHEDLEVLLVRGNHDARAGDPPAAWRFDCVDEPHWDDPLVLRHVPGTDERGYVLAGHLHPGVVLRAPGWPTMRLPCFHETPTCLTLPAFGSFTGLAEVSPAEGDRVYAISEDAVVPVPALGPGSLGRALRGLTR